MRRRGGRSTLAQTARWAQQRGALGLVIVNDRAAARPWPDVMTDSSAIILEETNDITIPVVLAPHGTSFPNNDDDDSSQTIGTTTTNTIIHLQGCLTIRENTDLTCCVCTESFCDTTTIRLSPCRHRFHESCAVTWLSLHNSCPYCRSSVVLTVEPMARPVGTQ
jgi:Ring finger domain